MTGVVKPARRGGWRAVEPEMGEPVFVCPACWPEVASVWRARREVTVRKLGARPRWTRCGVCDPEDIC